MRPLPETIRADAMLAESITRTCPPIGRRSVMTAFAGENNSYGVKMLFPVLDAGSPDTKGKELVEKGFSEKVEAVAAHEGREGGALDVGQCWSF